MPRYFNFLLSPSRYWLWTQGILTITTLETIYDSGAPLSFLELRFLPPVHLPSNYDPSKILIRRHDVSADLSQ